MPMHHWSQVDAGTFHAFHTAWITHLSEALNGGVLPSGYYALPEQHAGRFIADVLTLQTPMTAVPPAPTGEGGVAVAESQPRVRRKLSASSATRGAHRTLAIRHVSGNRIVALVGIVSPANKDRRAHVEAFIDKAEIALLHGIHLLLVDLFPPGSHDPRGMHGALGAVRRRALCSPPQRAVDARLLRRGAMSRRLRGTSRRRLTPCRDAALPEPRPLHPHAPGSDLHGCLPRSTRVYAQGPRRAPASAALTPPPIGLNCLHRNHSRVWCPSILTMRVCRHGASHAETPRRPGRQGDPPLHRQQMGRAGRRQALRRDQPR